MTAASLTRERWRFSAGVMLPVLGVLTITAIAVFGFVLYTASAIDDRSLNRQMRMVAHIMGQQLEQVAYDQESVSIWDDTVVNTRIDFDHEWVHSNLGAWMYDYFEHEQTAVLDAENDPIYMMQRGFSVSTDLYASIRHVVAPLVQRLRADLVGGALDAYEYIEGTPAPRASDFVVIYQRPAIVSVVPIISDTGALPQARGTELLLVSVKFLDRGLVGLLQEKYLFEDAEFSINGNDLQGRASYPLINRAGRFVAFVSWVPESPGHTLLLQTAPAFIAAFAIAAALVFLLLRRLWHSSAELESGRIYAEHVARHDRVTGLPNRNQFDEYLTEALSGCNPAAGCQISLMMLDLDRFKQVNDTLGHQAGDDLIRSVGARLRRLLGPDDRLARFGDDEFAIIHVSPSTPKDMMALSNRIIDAIAEPFEYKHYKAFVGVSIGIVTAGADGEPRELIRKADIALYEAKAAGRNRAVIYEESMNEQLQLQRTIEGELREALERDDQLSVMFQPLIDAASRRVIGAEALVRWSHPKYGHISPARFIPAAENSGQIEALGEFVLRRACELGAKSPGRTIAVNISPTQLRNPRFAIRVFLILEETGMRADDLELEITESILLDDEQVSSQVLRTLRAAGIHIALDDFGTGYSSLSYLTRYPVDRIKIDRAFISQLAKGHVSVAIVQAIITLAHAMTLEVTAEGVETDSQADMLSAMNCNTLQGYLFSPAIDPDSIAAMFADPVNSEAPVKRPLIHRLAAY